MHCRNCKSKHLRSADKSPYPGTVLNYSICYDIEQIGNSVRVCLCNRFGNLVHDDRSFSLSERKYEITRSTHSANRHLKIPFSKASSPYELFSVMLGNVGKRLEMAGIEHLRVTKK